MGEPQRQRQHRRPRPAPGVAAVRQIRHRQSRHLPARARHRQPPRRRARRQTSAAPATTTPSTTPPTTPPTTTTTTTRPPTTTTNATRRDLWRHFTMTALRAPPYGERHISRHRHHGHGRRSRPGEASQRLCCATRSIPSTSPVAASDLTREFGAYLHSQSGRTVVVSPLLFGALTVAVAVAERPMGRSIPPWATLLSALGYDRDFDHIGATWPGVRMRWAPLSASGTFISTPERVLSAFPGGAARPRIVKRRSRPLIGPYVAAGGYQLGTGVLVSIGGDVAVAGPAPNRGLADRDRHCFIDPGP